MRRLADLVVRWPFVVIGVWIAIAVVLPLTFPSLTEMTEKHPLAILPNDAPSSVAARQMTEAFHESGSNNLLVAAFINDSGLQQADEAQYRKVVDALKDDVTDVTMVQDFFTTPQLRPFLTSKDKTTWVLPVGLAGEMGTPRGYDAYKRVADLVKHNVADGALKVHVTGPAATVADLTVAGEQDRLPIEIAIAVMVLLVLLVVYRNPVTMLLPLVTIGAAFVTAQAAVAGVSDLFGIGVSNQSMIFLSAMIAGAGTDYAVFLISRYHDYLRQGADVNDAVKQALISIGKVITASAATVGVTFIGLSFAKMGVFSTIGVACAIAVGVAYLAAMTLLPAILVLAGARGWVKPRRELTARFWRRSGVRIVRRPRAHLIGSLLVLAILAGCAGLVNYNYDDRKALGRRCAELHGVRRAGTPFPDQPGRARVHPCRVAARSAHTAGPCGSGADGEPGQPAAGHQPHQRPDPTHRRGAAGVQGDLSSGCRRRSDGPGLAGDQRQQEGPQPVAERARAPWPQASTTCGPRSTRSRRACSG